MAKLTPAYTYTPAEELALWQEARVMASQNKSYAIRGRVFTRQDLPLINQMVRQLTAEVNATAGRSSVVIGQHARRV